MSAKQSSARQHGPTLWPLALAVIGGLLLLDNFLLLGDVSIRSYWPLLLVAAGAQILIRGDLLPGSASRSFGITRGGVQAATLDVSAGDVDVRIGALQREGRLIAGQFAAGARPSLTVRGAHAHLKLERGKTPWLSMANWQMALSRDLPWDIFVSTHVGQVRVNCAGLIVQDAVIATGPGDIEFTCPYEALGAVRLYSTMGTVRLITPRGHRARIVVDGGPAFSVKVDENRYQRMDDGSLVSRAHERTAPRVDVLIKGTFGDAYLA